MTRSRLLTVAAAALGLLAASAPRSQAAFTIFTDRAAFLAATPAEFIDSYQDLPGTGNLGTTALTRTGSGFGYTVRTGGLQGFQQELYDTQIGSDIGLSFQGNNNDTLNFGSFTGGVTSAGGTFYLTNIDGVSLNNLQDIRATVTDVNGLTSSFAVPPPVRATNFIGFISSGPAIASLVLSTTPFDQGYVTAGEFVAGGAAPTFVVPVPPTAAMAVLGMASFGGFGFLRRRLTGAAV